MKFLYLTAILSLFFAVPAVATDKPAPKGEGAKAEAPAKKQDTAPDAKTHTRPINDIESFFNEGMEQAKTMPPGCRPKMEPKSSTAPVA